MDQRMTLQTKASHGRRSLLLNFSSMSSEYYVMAEVCAGQTAFFFYLNAVVHSLVTWTIGVDVFWSESDVGLRGSSVNIEKFTRLIGETIAHQHEKWAQCHWRLQLANGSSAWMHHTVNGSLPSSYCASKLEVRAYYGTLPITSRLLQQKARMDEIAGMAIFSRGRFLR